MKKLLAAALLLGTATTADAAVIYTVDFGNAKLVYTSADFLTGYTTLSAAQLDSCTSIFGTCQSVYFNANTYDVEIGLRTSQSSASPSFFATGALGVIGTSKSTDRYVTLTVAQGAAATAGVPEPASWAMMIGGFGLVGGQARRARAVRTAARIA